MEELMQYVWQFRLWPLHDMSTIDGRRIVVVDPGTLNRDAGPDFFNAKVLIDGTMWSGNVEIHVRASDWYRHGHDRDEAYDSVVLHIVDVSDTEILRRDGQKIPQMVMQCSPDFSVKYRDMVHSTLRDLPCAEEIATLPGIYLTDWFSALAYERIYAKTDRITDALNLTSHNWMDVIYRTLSRALGFSINSQPFELLARCTPLKDMLHHTDSVFAIEAMLFGQAGFLDNVHPDGEDYPSRLAAEYRFLAAKYSLKRSDGMVWKMARMRPQNFPHRRIAALAQIISSNRMLSGRLLEVGSEEEARKLFDVQLTGYWASHYGFSDSGGNGQASRAFSYSSVTVLLINVVVPLIFAYALSTGDRLRQEFAIDLLHSLKPESNFIIETFARAGIKATDAFTTQALIQLKRDYCEPRKCLYCRIGHKLLSAKVKRISASKAGC